MLIAGMTCTDPGRPVDGYQSMQTKQYQESSEVYFNCSRPGFTIQGTNPIKCIINGAGTGLNWSAKVPTCTGEFCIHNFTKDMVCVILSVG